MAKPALLSLIKPIEATKLNPRNGLPLGGPDVTVFYGSLVEYVGPDHDCERFKYLNELYSCKRDVFHSATGGALSKGAAVEEEPEAAPEPELESEPANAEAAAAPRVRQGDGALEWSEVKSSRFSVTRAAIPGGWLVALNGASLTFVPDPHHQWDGGSL